MATDERSSWKVFRETVILLVVAVVLAIAVKTFLVQAFYIPSGSMEPGLQINDRILVEKPSYWFSSPKRGDIVVFGDPGGWLNEAENAGPTSAVSKGLEKIGLYPSGGHLVKRVIGVPGDTVVCCDKQGRISVNGTPLDEDEFIDPQQTCDGPQGPGCVPGWKAVVPKGKLFVMGDNRDDSADSSFHLCQSGGDTPCDPSSAFVDEKLVVGRVIALVWPFGRFSIEHRPDVFADVAPATK
ncbi:signal peptidase I [Nocardioides sp. Kera G14]|uniref:signal peptidase I n=1 Tax=Nocardioides sp. Kera G14 TaxID=2884264 RepID=UPI001D116985|nr:signal peptidase I [Nocardioides sp. Kera G14]UDY24224.1 signal peptidase I [Nocardioides sp. Kera G14]